MAKRKARPRKTEPVPARRLLNSSELIALGWGPRSFMGSVRSAVDLAKKWSAAPWGLAAECPRTMNAALSVVDLGEKILNDVDDLDHDRDGWSSLVFQFAVAWYEFQTRFLAEHGAIKLGQCVRENRVSKVMEAVAAAIEIDGLTPTEAFDKVGGDARRVWYTKANDRHAFLDAARRSRQK